MDLPGESPARKFVKRDFRKIKEALLVDGVETLNENDAVILVLGAPGAGKSTFIQTVAGPHYDWRPERNTISALRVTFNDDDNTNLVLVDTPGFDDPEKSDSQVLEIIAQWLQEVGKNTSARISGIIHLHSIAMPEDLDRDAGGFMADSAFKNLEMLQQLCGEEFYHRVILTTTMWPDHHLSPNTDRRLVWRCWRCENDLQQTYWESMIAGGVRIHRFPNICNIEDSRFSAQAIINRIIRTRGQQPMVKIQKEMVCNLKSVSETQAGRLLYGAQDGAQDAPTPAPTFTRVDTGRSMGSDESTSTITSDWLLSPGGPPPHAFHHLVPEASNLRMDHLSRRAKYNTTQPHTPHTAQPYIAQSHQPKSVWKRILSRIPISPLRQRQAHSHGHEGNY